MYTLKQITSEDYPLIEELYKLSFNLEVPRSRIELKYETSCYGLFTLGYFAISPEGESAAYYGVFPTIMTYNGQDYLVAQSGDTMTAPAHQRKGLFVKLALATFELAEKEGLPLIFGFPNKNSYPGFKKRLNWSFTGSMQRFIFSSGYFPLAEVAKRFSPFGVSYRNWIDRRLERYKLSPQDIDLALFNGKRGEGVKGSIKKELIFFERALTKEENYLIEIDGFTLLIKVDGQLIIGDIGAMDPERVPQLIKSLKKLAGVVWCSKVNITLSENHWLYSALAKEIEPEELMPIGYLHLSEKEKQPASEAVQRSESPLASAIEREVIDMGAVQFVGADFDTF